MAGELTQYQYYGLVGKGVTQATASLTKGFGDAASLDLQAGGYGLSAESADIQAEQVLLNAEAAANARLENYNISEASNAALTAAMGKTGENTTISDANLEAAEKDMSLMRRKGKMQNISARSVSSSARSAQRQSKIAANASMTQGILGGISSASGAFGSYGMLTGAKVGGSGGTGGSGGKSAGSKGNR